jgi:hypothetical protein
MFRTNGNAHIQSHKQILQSRLTCPLTARGLVDRILMSDPRASSTQLHCSAVTLRGFDPARHSLSCPGSTWVPGFLRPSIRTATLTGLQTAIITRPLHCAHEARTRFRRPARHSVVKGLVKRKSPETKIRGRTSVVTRARTKS